MWTKDPHGKLTFGILYFAWAKWDIPNTIAQTYFYSVKTAEYIKKNKCKIEYPNLPSTIHPVLYSIPVLVSIQLPSLEDLDYDEELWDSNDAGFEIEDDSARMGFDQYELNDLAWDYQKRLLNSLH